MIQFAAAAFIIGLLAAIATNLIARAMGIEDTGLLRVVVIALLIGGITLYTQRLKTPRK